MEAKDQPVTPQCWPLCFSCDVSQPIFYNYAGLLVRSGIFPEFTQDAFSLLGLTSIIFWYYCLYGMFFVFNYCYWKGRPNLQRGERSSVLWVIPKWPPTELSQCKARSFFQVSMCALRSKLVSYLPPAGEMYIEFLSPFLNQYRSGHWILGN